MTRFLYLVFIFLCIPGIFVQSEKLPYSNLGKFKSLAEDIVISEKIESGALTLISYNTWGLPISLSGHDQERRFADVSENLLKEEPDILMLQETFHTSIRENIINKLSGFYHTFTDYRKNREIIPFINIDCHGGLMTLSKYPIIEEKFFPFTLSKETSFIEKTGAKGFLISKIKFGNENIYVLNTHLYAGNNVKAEMQRRLQMEFIQKTLHELDLENETLILAGDFNVHHPCVSPSKVYDYITKELNYTDSKPVITEEDYTMDHVSNPFVSEKEPRTKLDYIFTSKAFSDNYAVVRQARTMTHHKPYSDHFGWKVEVKRKGYKL
jgi:endonuclease/exonuclease/phosphatase family metal-dependent hydrolase